MIDSRAVDVVAVWAVDRLVRKLADLEDVIERCENANVRLATVSGDMDLSTDAGRLMGRILASVARGEVERKSARQRRAYQQRAELGHPTQFAHPHSATPTTRPLRYRPRPPQWPMRAISCSPVGRCGPS